MRKNSAVIRGKYLDGLLLAAEQEGLIARLPDSAIDRPTAARWRPRALELAALFPRLHAGYGLEMPGLDELAAAGIVTAHPDESGRFEVEASSDPELVQDIFLIREMCGTRIAEIYRYGGALPKVTTALRLNFSTTWRTCFAVHVAKMIGDPELAVQMESRTRNGSAGSVEVVQAFEELYDNLSKSGKTFVDALEVYTAAAIAVASTVRADLQRCESERCPYFSTEIGGRWSTDRFPHVPDPTLYPRAQQLARVAISEVFDVVPRVSSLAAALEFREADVFAGYRALLPRFVRHLRGGKEEAAREIRKELRNIQEHLARAAKFRRASRWFSMLSLPVAASETLLGAPGIASLTLGTVGFTLGSSASAVERRNKWLILRT